jgi:RimJ/RimL family protein N-acetyltransferase
MRSERLYSEPWTYDHVQLLEQVEHDSGFKSFSHPPSYDLSSHDKRMQFIEKKLLLQSTHGFCKQPVFTTQNAHFIGLIGFEPFTFESNQFFELGFRLLKPYWGLGYATEFSTVLIREFLKERPNQKLGCLVHIENFTSDKTVRKLGYTPIKLFTHNGEPHNWYVF